MQIEYHADAADADAYTIYADNHQVSALLAFSAYMEKMMMTMMMVIPDQSHKNPVSVSAMLTGKFLQIRKVFATNSLLAEEFRDTLLHYKLSR